MSLNRAQAKVISCFLRRASELIEDALGVAETSGDVAAQAGIKSLYARIRDAQAEIETKLGAIERSKVNE